MAAIFALLDEDTVTTTLQTVPPVQVTIQITPLDHSDEDQHRPPTNQRLLDLAGQEWYRDATHLSAENIVGALQSELKRKEKMVDLLPQYHACLQDLRERNLII